MTDFNHSDPQNERRVNPPSSQETVYQNNPPVNPVQPNYQSQVPPPNYQQPYQQPYQQQAQYQNTPKTFPAVKVGEWMLAMFLMTIPLVGFILLLVWAFGSETNPSKSNWAKATLLWGVIYSVIIVIVYAIIFMVIGFSAQGLNYNF